MHFTETHGLLMLFGYFVFSAIVSGMPEPLSSSSRNYIWAYNSLHILSGDLSSLIGSRIPKK